MPADKIPTFQTSPLLAAFEAAVALQQALFFGNPLLITGRPEPATRARNAIAAWRFWSADFIDASSASDAAWSLLGGLFERERINRGENWQVASQRLLRDGAGNSIEAIQAEVAQGLVRAWEVQLRDCQTAFQRALPAPATSAFALGASASELAYSGRVWPQLFRLDAERTVIVTGRKRRPEDALDYSRQREIFDPKLPLAKKILRANHLPESWCEVTDELPPKDWRQNLRELWVQVGLTPDQWPVALSDNVSDDMITASWALNALWLALYRARSTD